MNERVPAFAGLGGAAALLLGSLLPWVSGPDAAGLVYGSATTADGAAALGSRAGLSGGDAVTTLAAALVALAAAVPLLLGVSRRWQRHALLAAGSLAALWCLLDAVEIGGTAGSDGTRLDLGPGIGLFLALLGAIAVIAAGAFAPADPVRDLLAASARNDRRWKRGGVHRDVVEERQRLLLTGARRLGPDHPAVLLEWLDLVEMYAGMGQPQRAMDAARYFLESSDRGLADRPEQRQLHRIAAADAFAVVDPAGTVPFAEGVLRETGELLGSDHPFTRYAVQTRDKIHMAAGGRVQGPPPYPAQGPPGPAWRPPGHGWQGHNPPPAPPPFR